MTKAIVAVVAVAAFLFVATMTTTLFASSSTFIHWTTKQWTCGPTPTHSRLSTNESFKDNYGAGELLNQREGRYRTHQYSLFRIFYYRLLESPYITDDPDRASLFFIPYDIGMDGSTRQSDGALVRTNCPRLDAVMSSLQSSRHFIRSGGSDHFMIHSINHMMLHFSAPQDLPQAIRPLPKLYKAVH